MFVKEVDQGDQKRVLNNCANQVEKLREVVNVNQVRNESKKRSSKSKCPKTKMASCSRHSLRTLKRLDNSSGITGSYKSSLCKKLIRKSGGWGVRGCKKITRLE